MDNYDKRVLDVAMGAGRILLQCGAEIFRVEETIKRISEKFYRKFMVFLCVKRIMIKCREFEKI